MRKNLFRIALFFILLSVAQTSPVLSQNPRGTAISHRQGERDKRLDDEFLMSHLEAEAGDLIGIVLPQRIIDLPIKKGWWEVAESNKASIVDHTPTSATVRLLKSGTTVVNFKYKIIREDREVSEAYPFTIRIHRIDPEVISLPSTLYLGWDMSENLQKHIKLLPQYSESPVMLSLDDPKVADIDEGFDGMRITGRKLGETKLHVDTGNGLHAVTRVVVEVPELKSIDIKAEDKTLQVGDIMPLQLKIYPMRAEAYVTWQSDKPEIVSVDQNGVITAVSEGKASIKVIADNGVKDSITIKVKKK